MPISVRYTSFPSFFFFYIYIYSWPTAKKKKKKRQSADLYTSFLFFFFFFTLYGPRPKTGKVPISIFLFPLFFILNIYSMAHGQKRQSANLYTSYFFFLFFTLYGPRPKTGKVPISIFSIFLFPVFLCPRDDSQGGIKICPRLSVRPFVTLYGIEFV